MNPGLLFNTNFEGLVSNHFFDEMSLGVDVKNQAEDHNDGNHDDLTLHVFFRGW